jgi:hypothetical protein
MSRDTSNRCKVRPGTAGGYLVFETPTSSPILVAMRNFDALVFAAWLVAIADKDGKAFEKILAEVKK